jgi:hypothetical protein
MGTYNCVPSAAPGFGYNPTFLGGGPVPGVFGAWNHLGGLGGLTVYKGRWIELTIWPSTLTAGYWLQMGIGAPGSEALYQPSSGGTGFFMDWLNVIQFTVPYQISFPVSMPVNSDISFRCASAPAGTGVLGVICTVWS